jgi:hypothetical protein
MCRISGSVATVEAAVIKKRSFSEYFFYKYDPISDALVEHDCGIYIHENKLQKRFHLF